MFLFSRSGLSKWVLLFAALVWLATDVKAASVKPPNIVFILVDDLDKGIFERMPRLRAQMTDQGMSFERHFVSISMCCPSRSATLRGQFAANTGMYGNAYPTGGFELFYKSRLEESTIATWLQTAGYRTALIGKYMNSYPLGGPSQTYIPPGWTEWFSPADGTPYESYNYGINQNGKLVQYGSQPQDHITDVTTGLAVDFLIRHRADHPEQPFFLYLNPFAPHSPATPQPRYAMTYPKAKVPRTPSFNEWDVSDKPQWVQDTPRLSAAEIVEMDELYANKLRSMLGVEDMVQAVLETLATQGQLENTYVIFTSDNGFHFGQHRMQQGKTTGYHEDLIVPLVVRGPGILAGAVNGHLTANVDYASTLAEMAGLSTPDFVDGRSLMPLLRGQTPPVWRQALLLERESNEKLTRTKGTEEPLDPFDVTPQKIRLGAFKGLRTSSGLTYIQYKTGEFELYDDTLDPYQLTNSYSQAPISLRQSLARWTAQLRTASGAALRVVEENPPAMR